MRKKRKKLKNKGLILFFLIAIAILITLGILYSLTFNSQIKRSSILLDNIQESTILPSTGWGPIVSIAFADLNNDGVKEIVINPGGTCDFINPCSNSGGVKVYDYSGSLLWERQLPFIDIIPLTLTIGDIDGDGVKEIIFSTHNTIDAKTIGISHELYVLKNDGTTKENWPVSISPGNGLFRTPNLVDVDRDGVLDIIVTFHSTINQLRAYKGDGTLLWSRDGPAGYSIIGPSAIGDINGDGIEEILTSFYGSGSGKILITNLDGSDFGTTLNINDGTIRSGFYEINTMVLGDINGDNDLDIAVLVNNNLRIYNSDGTLLWSKDLENLQSPSIILANVNNDENLEIFVSGAGYDQVYGLDHNGNNLPGWPVKDLGVSINSHGILPVIGDIDGDNDLEILFGVDKTSSHNPLGKCKLKAYNVDGTIVSGYPKQLGNDGINCNDIYSFILGNLKSDYLTKIGVTGGYAYDGLVFLDNGGLYNKLTMQWPQIFHDERHTSNYNSQCLDGTQLNQCTAYKPNYCNSIGKIVQYCQKCGCGNGICQDDGSCLVTKQPPKKPVLQ